MILDTGAKETWRGAIVAFLLLLCLCVSSWAACWSSPNTCPNTEIYCNSYDNCGGDYCGNMSAAPGCSVPYGDGYQYYTNCSYGSSNGIPSTSFAYGSISNTDNCWREWVRIFKFCSIVCSSKAEADSVACAHNPDLPNCRNACSDDKDECESAGGVWEGSVNGDECTSTCNVCNTPMVKEIENYTYTRCCEAGLTPEYRCGFVGPPVAGEMSIAWVIGTPTCNTSNWESNRICEEYYSSSAAAQSSSSSTPQSSSSSISEYCQIFPMDLACICATNPENPDCDYLNSSASEGSSGSESSGSGGEGSSDSGSGGENSSGSGGGSGGGPGGDGTSGDWEYDYRDSLHRIINTTARTANNTQQTAENTSIIKSILQNARCLFVDCTDYEALKDALDSNVDIPSGDTAGVLDSMGRFNNLDSLAGILGGYDWQSYSDSVGDALDSMGNRVDGFFSDSGLYGPLGDYRDMIEDNFPTAQWSYTQSCPAALNSNISFTFPAPIGTISSGKNLGGYFCGPLPPFNITLGNMIRAVIRLALTIAMAIGIFKAATGFNNE